MGLSALAGGVLSVLAGWLAGAAANWAAAALPFVGLPERSASGQSRERSGACVPRHCLTLAWYLPRRGHCPHCGQRLPVRAPLLELATIAAYGVAWLRFGPRWPALALAWLYASFLLTVLVIDLEHRRVLNVMLAPGAGLALLIAFLPGKPSPLDAIAGGAVGLGIFLVIALMTRGKMGAGDVRLAGVIGLMTGYPEVLSALALGVLLGGIAALVLLITRRATRRSTMAYAPYLALGALVVVYGVLGNG